MNTPSASPTQAVPVQNLPGARPALIGINRGGMAGTGLLTQFTFRIAPMTLCNCVAADAEGNAMVARRGP